MAEARVLIIGYGNPLRTDDGCGHAALQALRQRLADQPVHFLELHQLTPEIAFDMSRVERVIFIDASQEGRPGTVHVQTIQRIRSCNANTHEATPEGLLDACARWYSAEPTAVLCSISGASFELGESLSPAVQSALPELVDRIARMVFDRSAEVHHA
jgi:hydrogenase maturation protease